MENNKTKCMGCKCLEYSTEMYAPKTHYLCRKYRITKVTDERNVLLKIGCTENKGELFWNCKDCGENDQPKCHKCVREDGKLVSDELA